LGVGHDEHRHLGGSSMTINPLPSQGALQTGLDFRRIVIVAVGAFRHGAGDVSGERRSGTGGYALVGESLLPIHYDPGTSEGREQLNLASGEGIQITDQLLGPSIENSFSGDEERTRPREGPAQMFRPWTTQGVPERTGRPAAVIEEKPCPTRQEDAEPGCGNHFTDFVPGGDRPRHQSPLPNSCQDHRALRSMSALAVT